MDLILNLKVCAQDLGKSHKQLGAGRRPEGRVLTLIAGRRLGCNVRGELFEQMAKKGLQYRNYPVLDDSRGACSSSLVGRRFRYDHAMMLSTARRRDKAQRRPAN